MDELDEKAERLEKEKQAAERRKERHGPGSGSGWLDRRADAKTEAEELGAELRATEERRQEGAEWARERFAHRHNPREALLRDVGERLYEMGEEKREKLPEGLQGRATQLASAHGKRLQKAMEKAARSINRDRGHDRGMGMGM